MACPHRIAGHRPPHPAQADDCNLAHRAHSIEQLAGELDPGVRVNSVSAGVVRTEMARFVWKPGEEETAPGLPLARIGELEDVARAVQWLVSDAAGWVTSADLLVDGGTRGSSTANAVVPYDGSEGKGGRDEHADPAADGALADADLTGQEFYDGETPAVLVGIVVMQASGPGRAAGVRHGDPQGLGAERQMNRHVAVTVLGGVGGQFTDDEFGGCQVGGRQMPVRQGRFDDAACHRDPADLGGKRQDRTAGGGGPRAAGRGRPCPGASGIGARAGTSRPGRGGGASYGARVCGIGKNSGAHSRTPWLGLWRNAVLDGSLVCRDVPRCRGTR